MRFTVSWDRSPDRLIAQFNELPAVVAANVAAKVQSLTDFLADQVRGNLTSGDPLHEKTGALLRSIGQSFTADGLGAFGQVFSKGVPYAGIQERGGQTPPHDIYPVNAKALRFLARSKLSFRPGEQTGDPVFAAHVSHPGSTMPERSYLRRALAQNAAQIATEIKQAALDALRAQGFT
jgi:hypothetical protein